MLYKDAVTKLQVGGSVELKEYKKRYKIVSLRESYVDSKPTVLIVVKDFNTDYTIMVTHRDVRNFQF